MTLPINQSDSRGVATIIIPTYNRGELLIQALESCLNQTWRPIEIIIVDDGSTDDTVKVVSDLMARKWANLNIRLECQANSGASAARNRGLALATGQYVQYLDSDDWLEPDKIESQVAMLQSPGHEQDAGCYCLGRMGKEKHSVVIGRKCDCISELIEALASREVHVMQTSAPLWRRKFLLQQDGWRTDISLGDDLEYHVRLLCAASGMGFIDKELFFVREHDGPRLSDVNKSRKQVLSLILTRRYVYENLHKTGRWTIKVQRHFVNALRTLYANLLEYGRTEDIKTFEAFYASCAYQPNRVLFPLVLIGLRRCIGRSFLMSAFRLIKKI